MKGNVLFLTLNTFRSTGGIEEVCKTFCKVLTDIGIPFKAYAMHDDDQPDPLFIKPIHFKGFGGSKIKFGLRSIAQGLKSEVVIISHINLLLFVRIILFFAPGKRIILFAHGIEVWRKLSSWKKRILKKNIEIWAVSRFTANKLTEQHDIPLSKIFVLNNCLNPYFVPPENFEKPAKLLRRYRIKPEQPVLFTLTRISDSEKYKGYDIVINVLPKLIKDFAGLQYIISGKADSKERDRIVRLIKSLNLEAHVFLTGFVDYEELPQHFLLADCFVLPSKKEGFGIVFIESAACGCSVVAGNKDGSRDALLDGALGKLVNPDDENAVYLALKEVLKTPKNLTKARQIQEKCMQHFGFTQYKENVKALLYRG